MLPRPSKPLKALLAAWLLLMNLSLGLYHQHEPVAASAAPTSPGGWHFHVALLGVELEWLSLDSERCPFESHTTREGEVHLVLASQFDSSNDRDAGADVAPLLAELLPVMNVALPPSAETPRLDSVATSTPPPLAVSALGARSGVQQI